MTFSPTAHSKALPHPYLLCQLGRGRCWLARWPVAVEQTARKRAIRETPPRPASTHNYLPGCCVAKLPLFFSSFIQRAFLRRAGIEKVINWRGWHRAKKEQAVGLTARSAEQKRVQGKGDDNKGRVGEAWRGNGESRQRRDADGSKKGVG